MVPRMARTVAPLSPTQRVWRARIEATLHVAGPFLDLLLAAGDRVSRAVDRVGLEGPPSAHRVGAAVRALPGVRPRLGSGPRAD